jgi:HD-GYP domain-containing protein (c-di-GMP phosphodiesterase class II)
MTGELRLAEFIASLSLATDLGLGLPQEHVLRQTVIAMRLALCAELDEDARADVFYVSLLAWVGCVADSHELSRWFADDRRLRADSYEIDKTGLPLMRFMLARLGSEDPPLRRLSTIGRFLAGGYRDAVDGFVTHCQTTGDIADRLGLDRRVRRALAQAFERWDGKGVPERRAGSAIEPVMRIVHIADDAEVYLSRTDVDAVLAMLRSRRGTEFDPDLVDLCCAHADTIFGGLDVLDAWTTVLDDCPALDRRIPDDDLDAALEIFADYADLKSVWYLGHSRAVAELAASAARLVGLPRDTVTIVRRAGLVHRLGATGVSTAIWNKETPLRAAEIERLRQVPYFTERILSRHPRLAAIGNVAGMAWERMDGSGYPRGLAGPSIPVAGRVLAAAAAYQQLAEARPGRSALEPDERRRVVLADVAAGRLDGESVDAVLAAAGHPYRRRRQLVAGLTAREAEVLELLVRGLSNKQIAARLAISARTVATHIEHIFTKTGVTTRGAAAMFALRHGLVDAGTPAERSAERPM